MHGTWRGQVFYLVGGRGSGKTWAGARNFGEMVLETEPDEGDDHTEWAVIAPTYKDARDICIEGPSGLLRAFGGMADNGGLVRRWDRSYGKLTLVTGAVIWVDSANDGGQRIQGKNLYGAWADEVGLWKTWKRAWEESLLFAVRKGAGRIIASGTPKRSSLAKHLLDDESVDRRRLRTLDNVANLAAPVIEWLKRRYEGTALGRQELDGLLVEEVEGALWTRALIDAHRVESHEPPWWTRKIVGLDPADGTDDGDEQGLALIGLSPETHHLYVLESEGYRLTPWDFLVVAVDLAVEHKAEIVVEKNHGGAYLTTLLAQVMDKLDKHCPVRVVTASTGKRTRAEPVAGMYEQGRVHHVGHFADLEDQQCSFTGHEGAKEPSPDRLDALVHALTEFAIGISEPAYANYDGQDISEVRAWSTEYERERPWWEVAS